MNTVQTGGGGGGGGGGGYRNGKSGGGLDLWEVRPSTDKGESELINAP